MSGSLSVFLLSIAVVIVAVVLLVHLVRDHR